MLEASIGPLLFI